MSRTNDLLNKKDRAGLTKAERAELELLLTVKKTKALYNAGKAAPDKPTMTPREALHFGTQPMPYGQYQGANIASVPREYLDWLAGTSPLGEDKFKDDLAAYLRTTCEEQ